MSPNEMLELLKKLSNNVGVLGKEIANSDPLSDDYNRLIDNFVKSLAMIRTVSSALDDAIQKSNAVSEAEEDKGKVN